MPKANSICPGLILAAVMIAFGLGCPELLAAEAFHREGYEARKGAEDAAKAKERRNEDAVTHVREPWRGQDLTNRPKPEFRDFSELEGKVNQQKSLGDLRKSQADHAWDRRGDSEFQKLGIDSAKKLQDYAEDIRKNPDIVKDLDGNGRVAYGKFHSDGGSRGTVVVDNPKADNGGTIMTTRDLPDRMRTIR